MLNPSDMVGNHFLVTTETDGGMFQRLVRAFDEEDAVEQIMAYLASEGFTHGDVSIRKF